MGRTGPAAGSARTRNPPGGYRALGAGRPRPALRDARTPRPDPGVGVVAGRPAAGPQPVRALPAAIEVEPSNLSRQLAVLRRFGIVTSSRDGATVVHRLAGGDVADLMRAARRILTEMPAGRQELPDELREAEAAAS
ncbi:DNA-binding transcriptional ArsR family regulator [Embleya sp. AB8]